MIKTYSDRGSIKDLSQRHEDSDIPFTKSEIRFKQLYLLAINTRDTKLEESLGIITANETINKNNYPFISNKIKEFVNNRLSVAGDAINKIKKELDICMLTSSDYKQALEVAKVRPILRTAMRFNQNLFRRKV